MVLYAGVRRGRPGTYRPYVKVQVGICWGCLRIYIHSVPISGAYWGDVFGFYAFLPVPNHFDLINVDIRNRLGWGRLVLARGPRSCTC